ncbi:MFS transporter [Enterovibrio sp. ZSDZ35]|uniref:MFS transporter n=1 Tax=Enterovibrio qingdaonensis TaxID=2899818 RepID=A0ABT5QTI7_9GAMM|nr:MFS transporter [Enterovibrio sp. ZSDZ35]MDD1784297.1 MFS transporter [Enterovibrio sp. ZSDZ35]
MKTKLVYRLDKPRSVQKYIDEAPVWRDGTPTSRVPMTSMQWRIWLLASAGKFFEGMVVFMTGVALPLIELDFELSPSEKGFASAATLTGILFGASLLGGLADTVGRKRMFIIEMLLFTLFLFGVVLAPSLNWLLVFLFGVGLALGCDYPTAHLMLSESIPSKNRGRLVLSAFGFQAIGALTGVLIGYGILSYYADEGAWRWMYAVVLIPSIVVLILRFFIPESPHWFIDKHRKKEAEASLAVLLKRDPPYPPTINIKMPVMKVSRSNGEREKRLGSGYKRLFSQHRRATLLASIPWFLQDLSTYGIGIFTPTILVTLFGAYNTEHHTVAAVIQNDLLAAKGTAFLDVFLLVGIVVAVIFTDRVGRVTLQIVGFIGCATGLLLAMFSLFFDGEGQVLMLFSGFILFNFMNSMGPNAQTYLIAGEVFPSSIRGKGAGFAASFAKLGAIITAFLFPLFLASFGVKILLLLLVLTSLLGAIVTWHLRIETSGKDLETL